MMNAIFLTATINLSVKVKVAVQHCCPPFWRCQLFVRLPVVVGLPTAFSVG
jgi:hypothetical protein